MYTALAMLIPFGRFEQNAPSSVALFPSHSFRRTVSVAYAATQPLLRRNLGKEHPTFAAMQTFLRRNR